VTDCLFCRIARGEAPASVVHRDGLCVAIMDLYPMRPGHVLVLSRTHAVHLHELPEAERAHLLRVAAAVMEAQRAAGIRCDGGTLVVNDGPASGQHVPHVHVHAVPRTRRDWPRVLGRIALRMLNGFGPAADRAALDQLAARIRAHLPPGLAESGAER
jgi:histidine triad (HIT) family protein